MAGTSRRRCGRGNSQSAGLYAPQAFAKTPHGPARGGAVSLCACAFTLAAYSRSRHATADSTVNNTHSGKRHDRLCPLAASDRLSALVGALEEQIVPGWLQPHERLINEDIAERLGVKRHVVREAIFERERMGLAVRQPNKGAFVRILQVEDVMQIYEARVVLESHAAKRIPMPPPDEVLASLHDIQALHQAAAETQDPRAAFRANIRFHAVLFGACGNVHLTELIRQSAHKLHGILSMTDGDPTYLRRASSEHWAVIAALDQADRAGLVALCKQHIIPSRDLYLARAKNRRRPG